MKYFVSLVVSLLLVPSLGWAQEKPAPAPASGMKVEKIAVATGVENREPVGENTTFEASVGTLYCWTKITGATPPATIKHVWYQDGKQVFEKSLDLKYASTRTWSAKAVTPGNWKVDVTDESGAVLGSVSFTVK